MKPIAALFCLIFTVSLAYGQRAQCGQQTALLQLEDLEPGSIVAMETFHESMRNFSGSQSERLANEEVIYIPVVVHVVYNAAVQNLTEAQVLSQIDVLNEDFRRRNSDAHKTRPEFADIAADAQIQFCLADTDPNGNPTNGITRTFTPEESFDQTDPGGWDNVKQESTGGIDGWPRDDYLNIWVCNLDPESDILGYAYPPPTFPAWRDGVVINYRYFGRVGAVEGPYNKGRTTTHEVGHWLGLKHIWGDGACGIDDGIDDTPLQDGSNFGCPSTSPPSTCGSLDMYENFMEYVDDACMNAFTEGQAAYMRNVLSTARATISLSNGCSMEPSLTEDSLDGAEILVLPNPATGGYVQFLLDRPIAQGFSVALYNQLGQPVPFEIQSQDFQRSTICMDIANLPPGLYFVFVNSEGVKGNGKLIVAH